MKNMSALLILVLLCSLQLVSSAPLASEAGSDCCVKYYTKRIPLAKVVSYSRTRSTCAKPAVVFVTEKGRRLCVDPSASWVKSHVSQVDHRSTTSKHTSKSTKA
ncbi:C-C motif chemokine 3-like 1 [Megalops cyprinoides]|uniref:C-C motif chemokine 3-like 1 n=1 Tax=Megalops cyprinoides TaxID=118141 RepID=UPI001863CFD6|nr:C-C motif chemokine 3-like 1 [Megalops cyprinoides]